MPQRGREAAERGTDQPDATSTFEVCGRRNDFATSCNIYGQMVASTTGSLPDTILQGKTGMLVPFYDWKLRADSVLKTIYLPDDEWNNASAAARKKVAAEYDFSVTVPKVFAFFKGVLAGRTRCKGSNVLGLRGVLPEYQ